MAAQVERGVGGVRALARVWVLAVLCTTTYAAHEGVVDAAATQAATHATAGYQGFDDDFMMMNPMMNRLPTPVGTDPLHTTPAVAAAHFPSPAVMVPPVPGGMNGAYPGPNWAMERSSMVLAGADPYARMMRPTPYPFAPAWQPGMPVLAETASTTKASRSHYHAAHHSHSHSRGREREPRHERGRWDRRRGREPPRRRERESRRYERRRGEEREDRPRFRERQQQHASSHSHSHSHRSRDTAQQQHQQQQEQLMQQQQQLQLQQQQQAQAQAQQQQPIVLQQTADGQPLAIPAVMQGAPATPGAPPSMVSGYLVNVNALQQAGINVNAIPAAIPGATPIPPTAPTALSANGPSDNLAAVLSQLLGSGAANANAAVAGPTLEQQAMAHQQQQPQQVDPAAAGAATADASAANAAGAPVGDNFRFSQTQAQAQAQTGATEPGHKKKIVITTTTTTRRIPGGAGGDDEESGEEGGDEEGKSSASSASLSEKKEKLKAAQQQLAQLALSEAAKAREMLAQSQQQEKQMEQQREQQQEQQQRAAREQREKDRERRKVKRHERAEKRYLKRLKLLQQAAGMGGGAGGGPAAAGALMTALANALESGSSGSGSSGSSSSDSGSSSSSDSGSSGSSSDSESSAPESSDSGSSSISGSTLDSASSSGSSGSGSSSSGSSSSQSGSSGSSDSAIEKELESEGLPPPAGKKCRRRPSTATVNKKGILVDVLVSSEDDVDCDGESPLLQAKRKRLAELAKMLAAKEKQFTQEHDWLAKATTLIRSLREKTSNVVAHLNDLQADIVDNVKQKRALIADVQEMSQEDNAQRTLKKLIGQMNQLHAHSQAVKDQINGLNTARMSYLSKMNQVKQVLQELRARKLRSSYDTDAGIAAGAGGGSSLYGPASADAGQQVVLGSGQ